ncbi:MAG: hypothetical protein KIT84_31470 [Labilithrix sp.]|nr:hypothetical protein [Labilithrix sp.]MCW5815590.1 hypothetical protein [Labilithrix sp.]
MNAGNGKSTRHRAEILERRANVVRSRLLRAVDALDTRRHQVEELGARAKKAALPALAGALTVAALFGASAYALGVAVRRRRRRSLGERVVHAVREMDLVARPSFFRVAAEKVALAVLTYAATELARRATTNFVDGRLLDGRLAVGAALESHREVT